MNEGISIPDDCRIMFPMVECRLIYGLDDAGEPIIYQSWTDGDGEEDVSILTKSGLLTFAQQANTADYFMSDDEG